MRADQAGPALEVGRLGRSSNCSSFVPTKGRCGSNYRPLLAQNHKPPLRGSRTMPVLNEQDHHLKIQAASLCEALWFDSISPLARSRPQGGCYRGGAPELMEQAE